MTTLQSAQQLFAQAQQLAQNALARYGVLQDRWTAYTVLAVPIFWLMVVHAIFVRRQPKRVVSLADEIVLVTGGSSGIGLELVRQLSAAGSKVVVFDVHPPAQSELKSASFYKVDVTERKQVEAAAKAVQKEVGEVSILINNAGITTAPGTFLEADLDRQLRTVHVNLLSHFYLNRAFLPSMVKRNAGHIVTVASAASFVTPPGAVDYGVAKTGLLAMHEGLQVETETVLDAPNVCFTIVHPYFVTTPLIDGVFADTTKFLDAPGVATAIVRQLQSGRGGQLYLPGWVNVMRVLRALPHGVAHAIRKRGARDMMANLSEKTKAERGLKK